MTYLSANYAYQKAYCLALFRPTGRGGVKLSLYGTHKTRKEGNMNQNRVMVGVSKDTHAILTKMKEMPNETYDTLIRKLVLFGSPRSLNELTKEDYEWVLQIKN